VQNLGVEEFRARRDQYMNHLLALLKNDVKNCNGSCISGNILLGNTKAAGVITESELRSICLTMVSAGLDTIPSNIVACIGHLGHPLYGEFIQAKAFDAIQECYPDGDAWDRCITDTKYVPYMMMLIKETLRFTTSQPISLPRETYGSSIIYNQTAVIPPGTMLLMNTLAGNFDSRRYKDPFQFNPERFGPESEDTKLHNYTLDHFGFGAGSRMCAGYKLATRELYVMLVRLILTFKILPPKDSSLPILETDVVKRFSKVDNMVVDLNQFFVCLEPR
jgi:phenylacetate 2-hydroxylase